MIANLLALSSQLSLILYLVNCGFWDALVPLECSMFPPVIFRNLRNFTLVNVGVFIIGIIYHACLVVWPQ